MHKKIIQLSWNRMFFHLQQAAKVITLIVFLLLFFRCLMLVFFKSQASPSNTLLDYALFFKQAFLFDLRIACIFITPSFVLSLIFSWTTNSLEHFLKKIHFYTGLTAIILTVILCTLNIGFFYEYHSQFNQWIYGIWQDDTLAILISIWKTFPVIKILCFILCLSIIFIKVLKFYLRKNLSLSINNTQKTAYIFKTLFTLAIVSSYCIGLRGSIKSRPLQRDDIAVTKDAFLNKLVTNPYFSLYYTYSEQKTLQNAAGIEKFIKNTPLEEAIAKTFPNKPSLKENFSQWFESNIQTPAKATQKPSHIFLIVLESQDSWPLLEAYQSLPIAPYLNQLKSNAFYVKAFISAGTSTRTSLNALISGLPDAYVFTNFQPNSKSPYPTAIPQQFKKLGYETNLFYGGHLSWQRLGEFAHDQGFDNCYGREHLPANTPGDSWGVFDEHLFSFILHKLNPQKPSFNLIMTTSNHSPYPLDLAAIGCPLTQPTSYENSIFLKNTSTSPKILGHLWYNDHCTQKFIQAAKSKLLHPIFAITGDHTSRRFLSARPSLYEQKSVPFILYDPKNPSLSKIKTNSIAGSHIDIAPTLIDYIANKGFNFKSLGSSLFNPERLQAGFGADAVITPSHIWLIDEAYPPEPLPNTHSTALLKQDEALNLSYNTYHAIAWFCITQN